MDPQAQAPQPAPQDQPVTSAAPEAVVSAPIDQMAAPQPMASAAAPAPLPASGVNPGHGLGIAGLILAFIAPLIGLILSIIALSKSKKAQMSNGMAVAGIVISSITLLIYTIVAVVLIMAAMTVVQKCEDLGPGTHTVDGTTYTCS